jgi:hypothetical protein
MENLRLKAQKILQVKLSEKELNRSRKYRNKESIMSQSKEVFILKIQREVENFQKNLLESANKGEPLMIEILKLDRESLLSWWDERENRLVNKAYTPVKSEVITFIDDINLKFLTDDIITDRALQRLYDLIKDNDIYPQWRVSQKDGKIDALYLEANPNLSYQEGKEKFHREKNIKQKALVVQNYQNSIQNNREYTILEKIKNFILIFIPTLYFSVLILTILTKALGIITINSSNSLSNFIEIGWPYFLVKNFSEVGELFIISLPLGVLISLYFAYKRL